MKRSWMMVTIAVGIALGSLPGRAADTSDLYSSQAIVTGTGEVNRVLGFRVCVEQVLVKVSGDPSIVNEPGFDPILDDPGSFVASFRYRDRMEGIPVHDEQGTHDRPHDLYCSFEPKTIDPLLDMLGRKPWLEKRPTVAVFLAVQDQKRRFALASDGQGSPYMAESLMAASGPMALPVVVLTAKQLVADRLDFGSLEKADPKSLQAVARSAGADVALAGTLAWSNEDLGWIANWRLEHGGAVHRWQIRGVSFDDAFRNAVGGAAQILSGNGDPQPE